MTAGHHIVRQLHHIEEEPILVVASYMEEGELAGFPAREAHEITEPSKFAFVGAYIVKTIPPDDLDGEVETGRTTS